MHKLLSEITAFIAALFFWAGVITIVVSVAVGIAVVLLPLIALFFGLWLIYKADEVATNRAERQRARRFAVKK